VPAGRYAELSAVTGMVSAMSDAQKVVAAYWAAAEARDWPAFNDLIAEHVVYEAPQTRERVRGQVAYARFNAEGFLSDWHLTVERIVGEGRHAASWIQMSDADEQYPGLCFFDLDENGLITRITDFWPTPAEIPASRAHLAEHY
jgi:SnoaL-like domain